jgi:predicted DNA-binding protein (MmcQ/YjbR family)
MTKPGKAHAAIAQLRAWGLARYPGASLKSPWPGHADLAVKDKTFAYLSTEDEPEPGLSCKLPHSSDVALLLPFASPTGYGLGKSGWVTATFKPNDAVPLDLMKEWIDESYRAQAPKKLIAGLAAGGAVTKAPSSAKKNPPASKKAGAKKKTGAKKKR